MSCPGGEPKDRMNRAQFGVPWERVVRAVLCSQPGDLYVTTLGIDVG